MLKTGRLVINGKGAILIFLVATATLSNAVIFFRSYLGLSNVGISFLVLLSCAVLFSVRYINLTGEYSIAEFFKIRTLAELNLKEFPLMLIFLPSLYALADLLGEVRSPLQVDHITAIASAVIIAIFAIVEFKRRIKF